MWPNFAETIIILVICVAIFGLGKLDWLGEIVWNIRCRFNPSLESSEGGGDGAAGEAAQPKTNEPD